MDETLSDILLNSNQENTRPINTDGSIKSYKQENEELKQQLDEKTNQIRHCESLIDKLMMDLENIKKKMATWEENNEKLEQKVESLEDENIKLRQKLKNQEPLSDSNSNSPPSKKFKQ